MAKYKIELKRSAVKELRQLPADILPRILSKIEALGDDPRPSDCVKLSGEDKYRVRCGEHRILYSIEDNALFVCVVKIGHRRDVYRKR